MKGPGTLPVVRRVGSVGPVGPVGSVRSVRTRALGWGADWNWDTLATLVFAATPFLAVQAFADSDAGKAIFDRLKEEKPLLKKKALEDERARRRARAEDPSVAKLFPNGPDSYPGDVGFDPWNLSKDEAALDRYFEFELLHGRWAMLGALGAVVPELFPGNLPKEGTLWWNVGYYKLTSGEDLNYFGVEGLHVAGNQGILIIAIAQVLLMVRAARSLAHLRIGAPAQSRTRSLAHSRTRAPAQSLASSDPSTRVPVASRRSSRWASFCPAARITPVARCSTRCGCQMTHRRSAATRSRRLNTHGLPWSRGSSSRAWLPPGCPSSGGGEPSGM